MNIANEVEPKKSSSSIRKELRNKGETYTSSAGKIVPARIVRRLDPCRKICADTITYEVHKFIHKQYWGQGSYNSRKSYAIGLIEFEETKTIKRAKQDTNPKTRPHAYYYFLEVRGKKRKSNCRLH